MAAQIYLQSLERKIKVGEDDINDPNSVSFDCVDYDKNQKVRVVTLQAEDFVFESYTMSKEQKLLAVGNAQKSLDYIRDNNRVEWGYSWDQLCDYTNIYYTVPDFLQQISQELYKYVLIRFSLPFQEEVSKLNHQNKKPDNQSSKSYRLNKTLERIRDGKSNSASLSSYDFLKKQGGLIAGVSKIVSDAA